MLDVPVLEVLMNDISICLQQTQHMNKSPTGMIPHVTFNLNPFETLDLAFWKHWEAFRGLV